MADIITLREFSLGPGEVYMAPGRVSAGELYDITKKAGDTEGGCVLKYEYRTKELYDVRGNLATTLKFGEKLTVTGRLKRITENTLPMIISGDRSMGGRGQVSVLLLCPLPDGECFRLYVRGGVTDGAVFNVKEGGCVEFSLTCGKELADPEFCMRSVFSERGSALNEGIH